MSAKVNISGVEDIIDSFYRYQRNVLDVQTQKTKTSIPSAEICC